MPVLDRLAIRAGLAGDVPGGEERHHRQRRDRGRRAEPARLPGPVGPLGRSEVFERPPDRRIGRGCGRLYGLVARGARPSGRGARGSGSRPGSAWRGSRSGTWSGDHCGEYLLSNSRPAEAGTPTSGSSGPVGVPSSGGIFPDPGPAEAGTPTPESPGPVGVPPSGGIFPSIQDRLKPVFKRSDGGDFTIFAAPIRGPRPARLSSFRNSWLGLRVVRRRRRSRGNKAG